ncbi:MAG: hypothetical protein JNL74_14310 [Fibrobacteres bacterium]|nr:hypothetical protein [Fibrobacterota bacterium]
MVFHILAVAGFIVVFGAFLVISRTLNGMGMLLLRMEYLLKRELELLKEREKVKLKILREQLVDEERRRKIEEESDPLLKIPFKPKKA